MNGRVYRFLWCLGLLGWAHAHGANITVHLFEQSGTPIKDGAVIFDPQKTVPPLPDQTVVIDQRNKRFVPRMTIVRIGTSISFPNSDQTRHQVYSFSPAKTFALKLYAGAPQASIIFDKPGMVVLGCNIHDSMIAYVGVVDTPFFATTDADGTATLNLPAGDYRLRIWHASLAKPRAPRMIRVGSDSQSLSIGLDLAPDNASLPDWPE